MHKLLVLVSLLTSLGCAGTDRSSRSDDADALRTYPAASAPLQIMGRHLVDDAGAVAFGAGGVTFQMRFRGSRLDVDLDDPSADATNYNWFTVLVDGGEPVRFRTGPGVRRYTLAVGLPPGEHTAILSKATEGINGRNRLVAVHAAELLPSAPPPERRIEFIGDSITSGYGMDTRAFSCEEATWFDPTHAWLSYAPRLARHVEAQWMLSSISGIGMHRNWNSLAPVMPDVYAGVYMAHADSVTTWDFSRYVPDLVVIALGTNDFSEGDGETPRPDLDGEAFVRDYTRFVGTVRARYPQAQLLLVNSPVFGPDPKARLAGYLQQVIENRTAAGDAALAAFTYDGQYASGCSGHPGLEEHAQMADALEPVVRSLMGW